MFASGYVVIESLPLYGSRGSSIHPCLRRFLGLNPRPFDSRFGMALEVGLIALVPQCNPGLGLSWGEGLGIREWGLGTRDMGRLAERMVCRTRNKGREMVSVGGGGTRTEGRKAEDKDLGSRAKG